MDEQAKIERMLKLLLILASGLRYSLNDLSIKLEISERSIRRYIETFENVGFGIEKHNGFYWIEKLKEPFKQLGDLLYFTEEEAWIVSKAIHSIEENNLLKKNLVDKLYSLYNFGKVAETIVKREQSETVHTLAKAISTKKQVVLRAYRSSNSAIVRDRLVEPFQFNTNFVSFWAFDLESRTNKLFKTVRIESVDLMEKDFCFEEEHKAMPIDVFRISSAEKIEVKLKLNMRSYNLLIEEYPLSEKYIVTTSVNSYHFEGWVCNFEGVGRFVMGLCQDVEILAPQALKDYVIEKSKCRIK
ncbi:MAG: WYL domain-containing protein [Bacteroidales bacterium]|nr:WYL domain-containing protein [Bacteroidales bacterium]